MEKNGLYMEPEFEMIRVSADDVIVTSYCTGLDVLCGGVNTPIDCLNQDVLGCLGDVIDA